MLFRQVLQAMPILIWPGGNFGLTSELPTRKRKHRDTWGKKLVDICIYVITCIYLYIYTYMYFFHIENRQMECYELIDVTQHQGWWSNSLARGNSESSLTSGEFATGGTGDYSWSFRVSDIPQMTTQLIAAKQHTVGNCSSFDGSLRYKLDRHCVEHMQKKPERYTIMISLHFAIPRECNLVFQPVVFKAPSLLTSPGWCRLQQGYDDVWGDPFALGHATWPCGRCSLVAGGKCRLGHLQALHNFVSLCRRKPSINR